MFIDNEQYDFINKKMQNCTIPGYEYQGCGIFPMNVDNNTQMQTVIYQFSQRLTPFFNDDRKNKYTNVEIVLYLLNRQFFVSEVDYHSDASSTVRFLNSLVEYQQNMFNMTEFKASLPNALDDRFYFNEVTNTLNLKVNNNLNSIVYGINDLLGAREIILTIGTKLQG